MGVLVALLEEPISRLWDISPVLAIGLGALVAWAGWTTTGDLLDKRACPRGGSRVQRGVLACPECGFDFRQVGADGG
jgi:hypothetical protein